MRFNGSAGHGRKNAAQLPGTGGMFNEGSMVRDRV